MIIKLLDTTRRSDSCTKVRSLVTASMFTICSLLVTASIDRRADAVPAVCYAAAVCVLACAVLSLAFRRRPRLERLFNLMSKFVQVALVAVFFRVGEKKVIAEQLIFTFSLILADGLPINIQILRVAFGVACFTVKFDVELTYGVIAAASIDAIADTAILLYLYARTIIKTDEKINLPDNSQTHQEPIPSKQTKNLLAHRSRVTAELKKKIGTPEHSRKPIIK